ncbi:ABC transporter permease [Xanthobacteraceae bacterium A53D]
MTDFALRPSEDGHARQPASRKALPLVLSGGVALVVLLPVLALVEIAAQGSGDLWPHLWANVLPVALQQTGALLLGVGILTTLIAVPCAWLVATCDFPGRRIFDWALLLPLAVPSYIIAYSYLDVMHPLGPVQGTVRFLLGIDSPRGLRFPDLRSTWGCIFVLSVVLYPYVYLSARASFLVQSAAALDVARTLGAGPLRTFVRIAMPLARPAIVAGVTLALLEALADIGASEFLGMRTLTVSIYTTWVNRSNLPGAAQIALVMLLFVLLLIVAERAMRRSRRYVATGTARPQVPSRLRGIAAFGAVLMCALPILLGFGVPFLHLLSTSIHRIEFAGISPNILAEARNSALLAAAGTALALLLGLSVAVAHRLDRGRLGTVFARIASFGYAVPGTVLAIGLLTPFAAFDNLVDGLARQYAGVSTGLLISGSGGALVIAYAIRFLTIPVGGLEAGYAKMSPHLDMAASSLGSSRGRMIRRIHLPLLRPALATAALIVFVDGMKELPATLLLRPLGVETLSTHIYGEAARGTYEDGALAALLILLVGLIPVILLARISRGTTAISRSE